MIGSQAAPALAAGVSVDVRPRESWREVRPLWAELFAHSPYASFFLSPEWIESWLEVFGPQMDLEILLFRAGEDVIGACLLVFRVRRLGPIRLRRVYLNTAGEDHADTTYVEFNNLLCLAGREKEVAQTLADYLRPKSWDELVANGFCPGAPLEALQDALADAEPVTVAEPSFYIDLAAVRATEGSYEDSLGRTTRKNFRQSARSYSAMGPLRVEVARDVPGGLAMLDELAGLHQATWKARGHPGVFASARFTEFHRALIRKALPSDQVRLIRAAAGNQTIGLLYHFALRGKVYFYQCGFSYSDPRLSPGLVTHVLAVQHYLDQGQNDCDFLAGDSPHKKSICNAARQLLWVVFRRPTARNRILGLLRKVRQFSTQPRSPATLKQA